MPHLSGGAFDFKGDPERPDAFTVSYVEGFICRATPPVCSGVAMWERRFDGRATRLGDQSGGGVSIRSTAAATPLASSVGVNGFSTID